MEAATLLSWLSKESLCCLCQESFQRPVFIHCGHHFCQACIAQYWEELETNVACPQCGERSQEKSYTENQLLTRILERMKSLELREIQEAEDGRVCERHSEFLTVFCKEDQIPICLVCGISKAHRRHKVVPLQEAAQDYKEWLQMERKTWEQMRKSLQARKVAEEEKSWECLEQLGHERKKCLSEFEKLHQFLEDHKDILLAILEQLEKDVMEKERTITYRLSKDISSLSDLLSETEEKVKQPASEFLQDIKSIFKRCEDQMMQQPVNYSPALEERVSSFTEKCRHLEEHLKQFQDSLSTELRNTFLLKEELEVWKGRSRLFELPYIGMQKRGRRVNVTLDPKTANPFLVLSSDQKRVKLGDIWQDVPENPERFDTYPCVLGCEGFSTGQHYWEVEVGSGSYWAVGFATQSIRRKGEITPCPEEQIWALQKYGSCLEALTCPVITLSLNSSLQRVRVFLDYEGEQVAFFDADTSTLIYLFSPATFGQKMVFPWLWVWPGTELRLYQ